MDELLFASATALVRAIRRKTVSSEEVVSAYLNRIAYLQPKLNAVSQLMPDAIDQARAADAALARGEALGPLHGVPFTVKDVFETVGVVSPLDRELRNRSKPKHDATVIERMRHAGAVLLAKSNCPPNGNGVDSENTVIGRTLNPYDLTCTPGGSSGGEAALVASGCSPLGIGSDQRGGLRIPAHYCGVAALKPTTGRVPNTGAYNQPGGLSDPRTQIGPIARTVDDLTLILPILSGPDDYDSGVVPVPFKLAADDHLHNERDDLLPSALPIHPENLTVAWFAEDPMLAVTPETRLTLASCVQILSENGIEMHNLLPKDLVRQSREVDELWQNMAGSNGRTNLEVIAMWDDLRTRLLYFMAQYDAILCPVDHHPAPPFRERDNQRFAYTVPFSLTGAPVVTLRVGTSSRGLPIGVQIVARPWREDMALTIARILERELGGWKMPQL